MRKCALSTLLLSHVAGDDDIAITSASVSQSELVFFAIVNILASCKEFPSALSQALVPLTWWFVSFCIFVFYWDLFWYISVLLPLLFGAGVSINFWCYLSVSTYVGASVSLLFSYCLQCIMIDFCQIFVTCASCSSKEIFQVLLFLLSSQLKYAKQIC